MTCNHANYKIDGGTTRLVACESPNESGFQYNCTFNCTVIWQNKSLQTCQIKLNQKIRLEM